jgi:hypothetical protein
VLHATWDSPARGVRSRKPRSPPLQSQKGAVVEMTQEANGAVTTTFVATKGQGFLTPLV